MIAVGQAPDFCFTVVHSWIRFARKCMLLSLFYYSHHQVLKKLIKNCNFEFFSFYNNVRDCANDCAADSVYPEIIQLLDSPMNLLCNGGQSGFICVPICCKYNVVLCTQNFAVDQINHSIYLLEVLWKYEQCLYDGHMTTDATVVKSDMDVCNRKCGTLEQLGMFFPQRAMANPGLESLLGSNGVVDAVCK